MVVVVGEVVGEVVGVGITVEGILLIGVIEDKGYGERGEEEKRRRRGEERRDMDIVGEEDRKRKRKRRGRGGRDGSGECG